MRTISTAHSESRKLYPLDGVSCEICETEAATDRHHKDRQPRHNERENIVLCCESCHLREHDLLSKKRAQHMAAEVHDALKEEEHERTRRMNLDPSDPDYQLPTPCRLWRPHVARGFGMRLSDLPAGVGTALSELRKHPIGPQKAGKRLRRAMKLRGFSTWQTAIFFGVKEQSVQNWLKDATRIHALRISKLEELEAG